VESVSQEGAKEGNGGGEMLEGNLNGRTTTFSQPPGTATRALMFLSLTVLEYLLCGTCTRLTMVS